MNVRKLLSEKTQQFINNHIKSQQYQQLHSLILKQESIDEVTETVAQIINKNKDKDIESNTESLKKEFLSKQIREDKFDTSRFIHEKERIQRQIPEITKQITQSETIIAKTEEQNISYQSKIEEKRGEKQTQMERVKAVEGQMIVLTKKLRTLNAQLNELNSNDQSKTQYPRVEDDVISSSSRVHSHPYANTAQEYIPPNVNPRAKKLKEEINKLEQKKEELATKRNGKIRIHKALSYELKNLSQQLKTHGQQLERLKNANQKRDEEIKNKENRLREINVKLESINDREALRSRQEFQLEQLSPDNQKTLLEKMDAMKENLKNRAREKKRMAKTESYAMFLQELKNTKLPINCNLRLIIQKIENHRRIKEEYRLQENQLEHLKTKLDKLDKRLSDKQAEVEYYIDEVSKLETDIHQLKSNEPTLKEKIAKLSSQSKKQFKFAKIFAIPALLTGAGATALFLAVSLSPLLITLSFAPLAITGLLSIGYAIAGAVNRFRGKSKEKQIGKEKEAIDSKRSEITEAEASKKNLIEHVIPKAKKDIAHLSDTEIPEQKDRLEKVGMRVESSLVEAQDVPLFSTNTYQDGIFKTPGTNPEYIDGDQPFQPSAPPL